MQYFQKTEQIYVPQTEMTPIQDISKFVLDCFKIPDNNLEEITSFIKKDKELEKIIYDLPNLIKKEFPKDDIQIKFYDEFQEYELMLEIGIFTSFDEESSFEKEKSLENYLYDNYDWDAVDKVLIIMEY